MRSFFDPCVDCIIELVQGQIAQVDRLRTRLKVQTHLTREIVFTQLIFVLEYFPSRWFRGIRIFARRDPIFSPAKEHSATEARYFVSYILRRSIISN